MALVTICLTLVWLFGVWPPPVWWRDHWPRETAMMRQAGVGRSGGRAVVRPTPLNDVSPLLQRMVIIGEDSRFWTHHGIDFAEIADALGVDQGGGVRATLHAARRLDHIRGASTITQQLAKNLYLSPSRSLTRKLKEAVTALRLELALPKERILELYLAVAEWGPGIWGAQAASSAYFGVPASQLNEVAAAALAATLPHPRTSNPLFEPERTLARRDLILLRYHGGTVPLPVEEEEDTALVVEPEIVPPESLAVDSLTGDSLAVDSAVDTLGPSSEDTTGGASDTAP